MKFIAWLKLPETRNIRDLGDPSMTLLHAKLIQKKAFLRRLYDDSRAGIRYWHGFCIAEIERCSRKNSHL